MDFIEIKTIESIESMWRQQASAIIRIIIPINAQRMQIKGLVISSFRRE